MKTYQVTITARVTKTYTVEAQDEAEAEEIAHQDFDCGSVPQEVERYNQDTDAIVEL